MISAIVFVLYILCIRYCYNAAKKLGKDTTTAIIVGVVIPFGSALIYNHLSYRDKNKI